MSIPAYATNAVSCLAVRPGEHFQALVDEPFAEVGGQLCEAALAAGAASAACVVVPDAARPLLTAYEPLVASLAKTDALCFWFVHIHDGEFSGFRKPLYRRGLSEGTRIAFGGRMDRSILEHEMSADYGAVRALSAALAARLAGAHHVRVTTPAWGTRSSVMMRRPVGVPAPLAPTSATLAPSPTRNETSSSSTRPSGSS